MTMLGWLSQVFLLFAGGWSARSYARDFVRGYIRRLVRDRLLTGVLLTVSQLGLLAVTAFCVHRFGDPLAGRLVGSALVWLLIVFNVNRFFRSTLPDIAMARRQLAGPAGYVIRSVLGIDRKSTRLNSSHVESSYAVFCLQKKNRLRHHRGPGWR